jgi:hypothetical protein
MTNLDLMVVLNNLQDLVKEELTLAGLGSKNGG